MTILFPLLLMLPTFPLLDAVITGPGLRTGMAPELGAVIVPKGLTEQGWRGVGVPSPCQHWGQQ